MPGIIDPVERAVTRCVQRGVKGRRWGSENQRRGSIWHERQKLVAAPLPEAIASHAFEMEAHVEVDKGGLGTFAHLFEAMLLPAPIAAEAAGRSADTRLKKRLSELLRVSQADLPQRLRQVGQELAFHLATDRETSTCSRRRSGPTRPLWKRISQRLVLPMRCVRVFHGVHRRRCNVPSEAKGPVKELAGGRKIVLMNGDCSNAALLRSLHVEELNWFCRKVWYFGQNRKTDSNYFKNLQCQKLTKNKLCDRTA